MKNWKIDTGLLLIKAVFIAWLSLQPVFCGMLNAQTSVIPSGKIGYAALNTVVVGGLLGDELEKSEMGRLMSLPGWNDGELITMFSRESRANHSKTDWYGEHAGKWLYATALAANRTGDTKLKSLLLQTADYLVENQEANGYLGTYSPAQQLTNDKISHTRSWDVWNLSYMTLGLLTVNQYFPNASYENAARKIGELFLRTFGDGKNPVTGYGTRDGVSATIILDPVVELYRLTRDEKYLDFAKLIVKEMDEKEGLRLISTALHNRDMVNVGDGKAYQVIWNLKAVAGLYEITGEKKYLEAVENAWKNIRDWHLTICGGPWGGIGNFYECFDRAGFWSPYGFTETCSSMAWIQLNRELLKITGSARYADEIEKTTFNALAGASYPDGITWCYHSFANGRRHEAHFNDCCPSSGALALEEIAGIIYGKKNNGISVNIYTGSEATLDLPDGNVTIRQETAYPFDGRIRITLVPSGKGEFPVFVRIPGWAGNAVISVNGNVMDTAGMQSGEFFTISRQWKKNDQIEIEFPFDLRIVHHAEHATVPQGRDDIFRVRWFALTRGPLVYATNGLIGGTDREDVINLRDKDPGSVFIPVDTGNFTQAPEYKLNIAGKDPLYFSPYYDAGGRKAGTWHLTWLVDSISK